jgi:putative thioredoxin
MATPYSADVTLETFDALVLQKSHEIPVLVDFWAAWCGPCQSLMPRLAKLAEDYQGKFFLAKVDTDAEQKLAGQYGIRSLPTVKLFKGGQVVGEFMGAQPDKTIRELLDRHIARESDALLVEALRVEAAGDRMAAVAALRAAVAADPANDRVRVHLGRLLLEAAQTEDAAAVLKKVSADAPADPELGALLARLEFVRIASGAPSTEALAKTVAAEPGNSEARYQLAARQVLADAFEPAMEHLLEIVARDRKFGNDAARKALLTVFTLLGGKGELVKRYRARLSMALN